MSSACGLFQLRDEHCRLRDGVPCRFDITDINRTGCSGINDDGVIAGRIVDIDKGSTGGMIIENGQPRCDARLFVGFQRQITKGIATDLEMNVTSAPARAAATA